MRQVCIDAVAERQLAISFMTRAELMLWPVANNWGDSRRAALVQHLNLYTTLYPDEYTCAIWVKLWTNAGVRDIGSRPQKLGLRPQPGSGAFRW